MRLARQNAVRNRVEVDVRRSDLFSAFADLEGRVDVLTANPPYIAPAERDSLPLEVLLGDPEDALFDPEGGTGFHARLAARGADFLRPGGLLAMEIGADQGPAVVALAAAAGLAGARVMRDLAGRDRIVTGRRPSSTPSSRRAARR
jgi:release factor glutamine methyltransferase